MPKRVKTLRKIGELTPMQHIELMIGHGGRPWDSFEDDDHARATWEAHREYLLEVCRPGGRPWAWWRWDRGVQSGPANELLELIKLGELREDEVRHLRAIPGSTYWPDAAEAAWAAREAANA